VTLLNEDHPSLGYPNRITGEDFSGWVQERGLYFADSWDSSYVPILSAHDRNEPARSGGILIARHGQGYFCYTGLSFFRQLPAGVAGADVAECLGRLVERVGALDDRDDRAGLKQLAQR
jgi:hypothetical protein